VPAAGRFLPGHPRFLVWPTPAAIQCRGSRGPLGVTPQSSWRVELLLKRGCNLTFFFFSTPFSETLPSRFLSFACDSMSRAFFFASCDAGTSFWKFLGLHRPVFFCTCLTHYFNISSNQDVQRRLSCAAEEAGAKSRQVMTKKQNGAGCEINRMR